MSRTTLLNAKDKTFIINSLTTKSMMDISIDLNIHYETVRSFLSKRGLKAVKKSIETNKFNRPPATYSNADYSNINL